jgi:hypothetical protein
MIISAVKKCGKLIQDRRVFPQLLGRGIALKEG